MRIEDIILINILFLILIVLIVLCIITPSPEIIVKVNSTCKVQDNSNYSHWCEYTCGNNIFEEAIKCQDETKPKKAMGG